MVFGVIQISFYFSLAKESIGKENSTLFLTLSFSLTLEILQSALGVRVGTCQYKI